MGDGLGWAEPSGWVAGCLAASPRTGHTRPVAMVESFYDGCADHSWGKSKFFSRGVGEWGGTEKRMDIWSDRLQGRLE